MDAATQETRKRPILVWVVSLGYGLVALGSVINSFLLMTGAVPVPEPYRSDLASLGPLQWVPSLVGSLLMFGFCVALFRLSATAVRWCEALLVVSVATTAFQLIRLGIPAGGIGQIAVATTAFSLGLLAAIYLYSRRLRSRGALT